MPFDPTKPAPGDDLDAVLVRDQFNALKALIDDQASQLAAQAAQLSSQAAQLASLLAQLNALLADTSRNTNGVANLSLTITHDPPQTWEVQPIATKLDELIDALRR